jgi:hypothetical protein
MTEYFIIGVIVAFIYIARDTTMNAFDDTLDNMLYSDDPQKVRFAQWGTNNYILLRFLYMLVIFIGWPVVLYITIKNIV